MTYYYVRISSKKIWIYSTSCSVLSVVLSSCSPYQYGSPYHLPVTESSLIFPRDWHSAALSLNMWWTYYLIHFRFLNQPVIAHIHEKLGNVKFQLRYGNKKALSVHFQKKINISRNWFKFGLFLGSLWQDWDQGPNQDFQCGAPTPNGNPNLLFWNSQKLYEICQCLVPDRSFRINRKFRGRFSQQKLHKLCSTVMEDIY